MDNWLIGLSVAVGVGGTSDCDAGPFPLKVNWKEEENTVVVEVQGGLDYDLGDSFRSIVDLQLSIGEKDTKWIVGSMWPSKDMSITWRSKSRAKMNSEEKLVIKYRTNILSMTNLSEPSRQRNFRVLCASKCWFVDIYRLVDYGGVFVEWKKKRDEDATTQIVLIEDPSDMDCLFDALQAYDQPVVHRDNYSTLLPLASRLRLNKLLRSIEDWLMQSHFHPIRLLEIAAMYRMARLYDFGAKQLGRPIDALKTLHKYLAEHDCTMNDLPPALYSAFKMTSRTITM